MSNYKFILILIIYLFCCITIYNSNPQKNIEINNQEIIPNTIPTTKINNIKIKEKITIEQPIGYLIINKINLNKPLYKISSPKNNIEENVTILKESIKPNEQNSIFFLAAHSGTGNIAFFNELDKLSINDEIILIYENIKYIYQVKDIWETTKDGNIEIIKEDKNQLILTTCSKTSQSKQLIINCIKKV